ncbi:hypothetical protein [Flavobacterium pallidum]|uniref:Uncharacterized protein n=1 Tax=Flavobacterium pallidum TaxID=2172098 RepID=A0A2S1SKI4_9FLAO|nr:hypothetical protein [Flavobacterium pallidum]AWI26918.1 hypothetical protein HYN49_13950 [Flavobacterium pallidum]
MTLKLLLLTFLTSLSATAQTEGSIIVCNPKNKVELKTFMDTYEQSETIFRTLHTTKKLHANTYLASSDKKLECFFNIYATASGSEIYKFYDSIIPQPNEILFLFENDDPTGEFSDQSIFFKFGKDIVSALKNKTLSEDKIIGFLKCTVFPDAPFFTIAKVRQGFRNGVEKAGN